MQYQEAVRLGKLHRQLGLAEKARVYVKVTTDGAVGAYIWEMETGNTFTVVPGNVIRGQAAVPQHVKDIIAATDDELKRRWLSTMGWDEVRETVFSELAFRGTDMLKLEGIG
jgi:hypothetical protein